jgi:hypothetical protein
MTFGRILGIAALGWLLAVCFMRFASGAEKPLPMPPAVMPPAPNGCTILGVVNEHTVNVKDTNKPKLYWLTRVWFGDWKAILPWTRDTEEKAHADCVKWRKTLNAEMRRQYRAEKERP